MKRESVVKLIGGLSCGARDPHACKARRWVTRPQLCMQGHHMAPPQPHTTGSNVLHYKCPNAP